MKRDILLKKSMKSLEWPALLTQLEARARSDAGKELCVTLFPELSEELIETLQSETAEMVDLLQRDAVPVIAPFKDLRAEILETQKKVSLEPRTLLEIASIIKLAEEFRCFFKTFQGKPPWHLTEISSRFFDTGGIVNEIERAIDEQANIRESASPELEHLYLEKRRVRETVTNKLAPYLSGGQFRSSIREKYFTIREERYVVPVKSEMQKNIDGIIHDSSQSGMTLFIEPKELIPLNNRLRLVNLKIKKEIQRILGHLSGLVSLRGGELISNIETLAYFDLIQAKAEFALVMEAVRPEISKSGKICIKDGRHPLLVLQTGKSVSNTIYLGDETQVLVISGPNTGGKTVILKTVGLLSLMLRTGLHIPASQGSELPVFKEIFADIGDEQNLSNSLSTFAGHLKNVSGMMEHLSSSSIVLLDEFMSSTDPTEGSALAEAILDNFVRQGSKVFVSTHFSRLKFIAAEKDRFLNGSMEIDPSTLLPTYRLIQGVPGRSHALDIAERLGMNKEVLLRAGSLVEPDDRNIEKMIKLLAVERKELQDEKERILIIKKEAQSLNEEAQQIKDDLYQKNLSFKRERSGALKKEIALAKARIQEALSELKGNQTERLAEKASRTLRELESAGEPPPDTAGCAPVSTFNQGDYIYIPALRIAGTVLSKPSKKNIQKICAGKAEITVNSKSTYGKKINKPSTQQSGKRLRNHPPGKTRERVDVRSYTKCSLRGLDQEAAIEKLTNFLDNAMQDDVHSVTIIHGHGTGILKKSVRKYLETSPYANSFEPGISCEGGDGVTVVKLNK